MNGFWDECLALPSKIKDWDGYVNLNASIQKILQLLPILHRLHAKVLFHFLLDTIALCSAAFNFNFHFHFHFHFHLDIIIVQPFLESIALQEIRNRHWLQVMAVVGSSFALEASLFTVSFLLDIPLYESAPLFALLH